MSLSSYPVSIKNVLAHEGGYTNHPADPGGPTNWGITIFDARKYWKASATAADVKAMPLSVAQEIYDKHYWDSQRCDDLPPGLDYSMFDYGVNSGIGRSGKVLRRLLGLPDNTSVVTQEVIDAVRKRDPSALITALNDERLRFLKSLKTWPTFGGGWGRRVAEVKSVSLQMAAGAVTTQATVTPSSETMAKGAVASQVKHEAAKANVGKAGAAVSVGGAGLGAWLGEHPGYGALAVGIGVVVTVAMIELLNHRFNAKQEAPTPGIVPVPASA